MTRTFTEILAELPRFRKAAEEIREILLANLVMISEIPAPTFGEEERIQLIQQRFSECGLQNCSTDEKGNGVGVIPGERDNNILLVAHADTVFPEGVDHTVTLQSNTATGPGLGDNSLACAVLVTLPTLLDYLGIRLNASLILMAAARSLGRGNLEGLRFFLANNPDPLRAGLCIEGVPLGRLNFSSIGMLRGEITVSVPEEYDWTRFGATNAIVTLNEMINRLNEIRMPRRPRTSIVIGSIEGGKGFDTIATQAVLRLEIRSESAPIVREVRENLEDIASEVSSRTGARVKVEVVARRRPGGIPFSHPMARCARRIMRALDVTPRIFPSTSELSAFIARRIPALTVGISRGEHLNEVNETVEIEPMFVGLAQLIGLLLAVDGGFCDED